MEYTVYAISSLHRNYIYVGLTSNIKRRLSDHQNGYNKTTKPYAPFRLIHLVSCPNRQEARALEKKMKSSSWREKLRILADHPVGGP